MEDPAGIWFSDRVDGAKVRRNRLRWYAAAFNGLFLSLFGAGRFGTILFAVATCFLGHEHLESVMHWAFVRRQQVGVTKALP